VLAFALLVYFFGSLAAMVRPSVGASALWWPGAGLAVLGLLLVGPRRRAALLLAVTLASILSSLVGGRGTSIAVLFALINAAEAALVYTILAHRRSDPRALQDLDDLSRLLAAVLIGGATAGVAVGVVATALLDVAFLTTVASATASHADAVLMLVIVGLRVPAARVEASDLEQSVQWVAVAVATVLIFSPRQALPLAFLLPVSILWGALRSSIRSASLQLLTVSILASVFSGARRSSTGPAARSCSGSTSRARCSGCSCSVRKPRVSGSSNSTVLPPGCWAARLDGSPPASGECPSPVRTSSSSMQRWQPSKGETSGWHAEVRVELHGRVRWCEVALSPAVELAAEGNLVTVQMVDVTSRREAEERLAHLALRDGLTGLANRVLLDDRLQLALTECRRTGLQVGVAFLDVDSFKLMNDVHGHDVGDRFLVVLGEVVARIRGAVGPPVTFAGVTVASDISIGATLGGGDCEPRELLRRADAAMYAQKKAGGGRTLEGFAAVKAGASAPPLGNRRDPK
jgi:GGDEF domain-containing protein/integral membrane sensor domain MASE1